jgi:hypothetical protein
VAILAQGHHEIAPAQAPRLLLVKTLPMIKDISSMRASLHHDARVLRRARQFAAKQNAPAKIMQSTKMTKSMQHQLVHWEHWYAGTCCGDGLVMIPVAKPIAARVRAKADSMLVHWHQAQHFQRDFHSGRSAGQFAIGGQLSEIHTRGNVASHSGMFTVSNFETLSPIDIKRIQRGQGKDTSEALDPWVLLDGMASSSATSTSGPFLLDAGSSELMEPPLGCASMSQSSASFDAMQVIGAWMAIPESY